MSLTSASGADLDALLDNPIWNALRTGHAEFALGDQRAQRYPEAIGPLSGVADHSAESYHSLGQLAGPGGVVVLFCTEPPAPPAGWTLIRGGLLAQMVSSSPSGPEHSLPPAGVQVRELTAADVPAMVALAELTEPGPFRQRTIELGRFLGVIEGERLLAMAGQRMLLPGHVEVSAVCTHPDARGRGYARLLMSMVMDDIRRRGKIPFLHTFADNQPAIRVYESLGFAVRRNFDLAVLKNEG